MNLRNERIKDVSFSNSGFANLRGNLLHLNVNFAILGFRDLEIPDLGKSGNQDSEQRGSRFQKVIAEKLDFHPW
jgi:hypothetical protein